MAEVSDIRSVGRGSRRRRVYLDGSEWRSVPAEVVREIGLRVGQAVEPETLESRILEAESTQAWDRTLRLLNYRERGSGELRRRLSDDGYTPEAAEEAVTRAVELGFLDDRRFAEGLARGIAEGKRQGRRRVAAGLAAKGVDEALAADVLASYCDEDAERRRAVELALRLTARSRIELPRLASRLVAKGFDTSLAWRVAREISQAADEPSDEG